MKKFEMIFLTVVLSISLVRAQTNGEQAQRNARPVEQASYRQLDFWVGEWDVINGKEPAGTSSVQRILDGCVIFENWSGAKGYAGKSFNFYQAEIGQWRQVWVDNRGGVLEFTGEYKDGAMYYRGESRDGNSTKLLHRMTFFKLSSDRVRQLWEQSKDEGKTWTVAFDGDYQRKR